MAKQLLPLLLLTAFTSALPQPQTQNTEPTTPQCNGISISNTQADAPHGLYQISHQDVPADGAVDGSEYIVAPNPGEGTCAFAIDTGVRPDHNEYADRLIALWDCIGASSANDQSAQNKFGCTEINKDSNAARTIDGNGHGTHTAATILGTKYGVAKKAKLIGIRVLNAQGGGNTNDIAAGVKLAAKLHGELSQPGGECHKGTACNLSLGGGLLASFLDGGSGKQVLNDAADAGLFCAVAAGNSDSDAVFFTPASAFKACTVGALDSANEKACFSNYGDDVIDVWAPGVNVRSAFIGGDADKSEVLSGTSMAAPHIAGLKLYFDSLCGGSKRRTPEEACQYIKDTGFEFDWATGFSDPAGFAGLPVPTGLGLQECPVAKLLLEVGDVLPVPLLDLLGIVGTGKRAFNGGACACEGW